MNPHQSLLPWDFNGRRFSIPIERTGQGPMILLLPALSSISTLGEMAPLRDRLSGAYETVSADWPGFGMAGGPSFAWTPPALKAYLDHLLDGLTPHLFATVAAGHAATYLIDAARRRPGIAGRLVLVAPTWRGPLPTMMGRRSALGAALARIGDIPLLGQMLYRLNVNRPMVGFMAREHVYESAAWLEEDRLERKMAVTRSPGGRHAALRFVTGQLDPMESREAFIDAARGVIDPLLLVYGNTSPRKSKAEMEALAALPTIEARCLPKGKLALHEEYPDAVFETIRPFLERA